MVETRYVTYSGGSTEGTYYQVDGTNDQTKINEALAWAAGQTDGGIVVLRGAHTYSIRGQIKIGSNTVFTAEEGVTLKIPDGACGTTSSDCVFPNGTPVIGMLTSTYIKNVEIYNFEIDGNCGNQAADLGLAHGSPSSPGSGVERLIGIHGVSGTTGTKASNINIHDMYMHDAFGEALHIYFAETVKFHHNTCSNHQHCALFAVEVTGSGNEIHDNSIAGITSDCIRFDNCQNVEIYNNNLTAYSGSDYAGTTLYGHNGIQIANEPSSTNRSFTTENINVHDNIISGQNLSGMWICDNLKTAGTTAKSVHVYNNTFNNGCGWASWTIYAVGIGIQWGNGLLIENNTFDGCYNEAIHVYGKITTNTTTINIKNNNILNTKSYRAGSTGHPSISGYGIANTVGSYVVVNAENNYCMGNVSGNYYGVTPASEAEATVSDSIPNTGTTDDDDVGTPEQTNGGGGIYIPASVAIIDDEYSYIERDANDYSAYVNYIPFQVQAFKGSGSKTYGRSKSPSVAGTNLSDFDFEGSPVKFACKADSLDELNRVLAAFYKRGRTTIELGGVFKGYKITGMGVNHDADFDKTKGDIPEECFEYSLDFQSERPYMEKIQKRVRGRYVYDSMKFSSDDMYAGNICKNPSFENWMSNSNIDFDLMTATAANQWRTIRYAAEIDQYCAVGIDATTDTGIDNIMLCSDGASWHVPTGLSNATNHASNIRAVSWCPDWGKWVALTNGASSVTGYGCIVSDVTGETWTAKATPLTPVNFHSMYWANSIFIPPNETLPNGRYLAVSSGTSETYRVAYTDDAGDNWTMKQSADDTYNWLALDYDPVSQRVVCVAYSGTAGGQVMYTDDFGDNWTKCTGVPSGQWSDVKWCDLLGLWVACSQNALAANNYNQIMTSPTGETWTIQETPYIGSVTSGGGETLDTLAEESPAGYNYTTKYTTYQLEYTFTLPASEGCYRLDNIHCDLKALSSGATAYCKVTVSSTSLGTDTLLKEWTETRTTYTEHSETPMLNGEIVESAVGEAVTLKFWIKTNNTNIKAAVTAMGYSATESTSSGSTVTNYVGALRALAWARDLGLILCVCQDTTIANRIFYSSNGTSWNVLDSASMDSYVSICYADQRVQFMAVSVSGKVMGCSDYGTYRNVAPVSWTLGKEGQSRSEAFATDGIYSLQINGDGVTEEVGKVWQILPFDSLYDAGEMYLLSAKGKVTGLSAGSFRVDLYAGGSVIKELIWDSDTTDAIDTDGWVRKEIKFKFDTIPSLVYLRVHGSGTPNIGSQFNSDDVIISKQTDFEVAATGSEISTNGYYDIIPDVTVTGVSVETSSPSTSRTVQGETPDYGGTDYGVMANTSTSYGEARFTVGLEPLGEGSCHRINCLYFTIKSSSVNAYTYIKVTVQAASLWGGVEKDIALWTTNKTSWQKFVYNLPYTLQGAANEAMTIRYYIRTSKTPYTAYCKNLGYIRTEILDAAVASSSEIYLYNDADTRKVLKCCNVLPQGYQVKINANYTGSYRYVEPFADSAYATNAYSISGTVSRNDTTHTLSMSSGSSIVFPFDCLYPVTGIPFLKMYVVSGSPVISIADDSGTNGAPGTWYTVDSNKLVDTANIEIDRELDNYDNFRLRGKTKWYVKIEPTSGQACEYGQLMIYTSLDTMDAQRIYIYANGGKANTFVSYVGDGTGKCSAVVSLGYHDSNILP